MSRFVYLLCIIYIQRISLPSSSSFDSIRTLRMASYGMLILGPSQHFWFNYMSKVFPKRDIVSTLKKLSLGQGVFGPSITAVFFSYNASLQGNFFIYICCQENCANPFWLHNTNKDIFYIWIKYKIIPNYMITYNMCNPK